MSETKERYVIADHQYEGIEEKKYQIVGVEGRNSALFVFPPDLATAPATTTEVAVAAGIVVNFLKKELPRQMLAVVLTMLYKDNERFADSIIQELKETVVLQRALLHDLRPPEKVVGMVSDFIDLAGSNNYPDIADWLTAVEMEGYGEEERDDVGDPPLVGEGATSDAEGP